jgi:hypothetical protein
MKLATDTVTRKTITKRCEYYGVGAVNTGVSRTVCMPIPTTLSTTSKIIPLAVLQGGWSLNYQLAPYLTLQLTTLQMQVILMVSPIWKLFVV